MLRIAARSLSVLLLLAAGCHSHDNVGKPCDKADQCDEGMICDFHDGKGTCQEPHGHGTAGETAATTDHHDSDHDSDHHHDSSSTGPTEGTTGTSHDHGETEHEHTGTTAGTSSSTG